VAVPAEAPGDHPGLAAVEACGGEHARKLLFEKCRHGDHLSSSLLSPIVTTAAVHVGNGSGDER
jgi:hypothetical protein